MEGKRLGSVMDTGLLRKEGDICHVYLTSNFVDESNGHPILAEPKQGSHYFLFWSALAQPSSNPNQRVG